jgi:hypothetical protein
MFVCGNIKSFHLFRARMGHISSVGLSDYIQVYWACKTKGFALQFQNRLFIRGLDMNPRHCACSKFEHLEVVLLCVIFQHSTINCATRLLVETGSEDQMLMAVEVQHFSGIHKPHQRRWIVCQWMPNSVPHRDCS